MGNGTGRQLLWGGTTLLLTLSSCSNNFSPAGACRSSHPLSRGGSRQVETIFINIKLELAMTGLEAEAS